MDKNQSPAPVDVIYRTDAAGRVADFIAGPETRLIYTRPLHRAMAGMAITLPYRCDSPALRRRMSLTIARQGDEIEFRSTVLDLQRRPAVQVRARHSPERTRC